MVSHRNVTETRIEAVRAREQSVEMGTWATVQRDLGNWDLACMATKDGQSLEYGRDTARSRTGEGTIGGDGATMGGDGAI